MVNYGDICKIDGSKVEIVDVITGGSPCQDLSVAGKRKGLAGERSGLFMEQIRIIKEQRDEAIKIQLQRADEPIRPRFMVWENVYGAFSSNKGEDFRAVLEEVARVKDKDAVIPGPPKDGWAHAGFIMGEGYSVAWRGHDAQYWGVPQRRKRICLLADFEGGAAPKILFETELWRETEQGEPYEAIPGFGEEPKREIQSIGKGVSRDIEPSRETEQRTAGDLEEGIGEAGGAIILENHPSDGRISISKDNIVQTLRSRMGTGGGNVPMVVGCDLYNQTTTGEVSKTLNAIKSDSDHVPCIMEQRVYDAYGGGGKNQSHQVKQDFF